MEPYFAFALKHPELVGIWALILLAFMIVEWRRRSIQPLLRSAQEVTRSINHEQARLLDVRTKVQYDAGHVIGAKWAELARVQQEGVKSVKRFSNTPIILMCEDGRASLRLAQQLSRQGTPHVFALEGGVNAWRREGFPLVQE